VAESSDTDIAKRLVMNMLLEVQNPTQDEIRRRVNMVVSMLRSDNPRIDVDQESLVREVESLCNVWVPDASTLDDRKGHVEWLANKKSEIDWRFWDRYRTLLSDVLQLPPDVVRQTDQVTDEILRRLEDPTRPGAWDRRGLVVGQVQSGKTGNYLGLIAKAIDAGYRLIVVLAGMHNSLRSQTQLRMDEAVIGFDTQKRMNYDQTNTRMGVGLLQGFDFYRAHPLTTSSETGDFKLNIAKQANVVPGGAEPVLLVVKKYSSILSNLIKWATLVLQQPDPDSGRAIVRDVPLLVIDDEADNASVNTKKPPANEFGQRMDEEDPTRINGLIRELLNSFEQKAYVGYTATPFANIFIDDQIMSEKFGEELFPRSFIINLRPPSDYMGPARVFGLQERLPEDASGLPIIREILDHEEWIEDGHKKDWVLGGLPESLREAIHSFVLTIAARVARGQDRVHNSMLVHVTRYTAVQEQVADQIQEELSFLARRLAFGDGASRDQVRDELRQRWIEDFVPTSKAMNQALPEWEVIDKFLHRAASRIQVKKINGTAKDALEYFEHKDGLSVIAVGGDKLSRGLTLEGLTVSYYLRASKMYDTLMQMGRWFGYRPGYEDLCRLYTTPELVEWYRDITAASEELREEFDYMVAAGATPEDFGLRVRNHPDGLLITARAKMRNGQKVSISYAGTMPETIDFFSDAENLNHNFEVTENFIQTLQESYKRDDSEDRDNYVWLDVKGEDVASYLETFRTHPAARKAQSPLLGKYIRSRMRDGELIDWTVALVSNPKAEVMAKISELSVGLIQRSSLHTAKELGRYVIRRIVSPNHEWIDLSPEQRDRALRATRYEYEQDPGRYKSAPDRPGGLHIRNERRPQRGLLLLYPLDPRRASIASDQPIIGWAVSFPGSPRAQPIEYVVNNVYWEQEFGGP
jgi:hypothetical protein